MLDLVARAGAAEHDGHERQARGKRRHENGRQAFLRSSQNQLAAEGHALLQFEMPVVADQHDPVSGRDADHGDQPDQRSERQHAAGQERRDDRPDQGKRQRQEDERGHSRRSEVGHAGSGRWPRPRSRRAASVESTTPGARHTRPTPRRRSPAETTRPRAAPECPGRPHQGPGRARSRSRRCVGTRSRG